MSSPAFSGSELQMLVILIGMWWYLIVVLIPIFLMTYVVEHFFMCLFSCAYILWWGSVKVFGPFFNQVASYCWVLAVLYQMCFISIFSESVICLLIILKWFLKIKVFNFNEVQYQLFLWLIFPLVCNASIHVNRHFILFYLYSVSHWIL